MIPKGLGLYTRAMSERRHGTPKAFAERCKHHGINWVAIGGPWHTEKAQRSANPRARFLRYADAAASAGVSVHVWGYPHRAHVEKFVAQMIGVSEAVDGWLLDPELGMKGDRTANMHLAAASREVCADLGICCGWTSYGSIHGHTGPRGLEIEPYKALDYGSPQLYTVDAEGAKKGMLVWSRLGAPVIPSFGCYNRLSGRVIKRGPDSLAAHFEDLVGSGIPFDAMIGWEWALVRRESWATLQKLSEQLAERACLP